MMVKERSTRIVNFMTPEADVLLLWHGHIGHIVKMHIFFEKCSLLRGKDQTNYVYSNDVQGRVYQNYKFHDPRGRGSCARALPCKSYSENALFL